ncbi:MAG: hypothetical protein V2B20_08115 [Pseudomonadota bacterium]
MPIPVEGHRSINRYFQTVSGGQAPNACHQRIGAGIVIEEQNFGYRGKIKRLCLS